MLLKKEGSEAVNYFLDGCMGMWLLLIFSLSVSNINSCPVLWAQKLHCHEGEGEKEASHVKDIACRPFCVSPRVPGFCLCFTPAVLGLSPGAGGQGAAMEKRPYELEAKAALLAETCRGEKVGGPLCLGSRRGSQSQPFPRREGLQHPSSGDGHRHQLPCKHEVPCKPWSPYLSSVLWPGFESRI